MKVTVETYCFVSDTYRCMTGKGRTVYVSLVNMPEETAARFGGYYKVRNDSGLIGGVFYPQTGYQFYELNKVTGKKLHVVPDEL